MSSDPRSTRSRRLQAALAAGPAVLVLAGGVALATLPASAAPKAGAPKGSTTTSTTKPATTTAPSTTAAPPATSSTAAAPSTTATTTAPATAATLAPTTTAAPPTPTTAGPTATTTTAAPQPPAMLLGTRNPLAGEPATLAALAAWQGKANAIVQTYVRSTWTPGHVVALADAIWAAGSVPAISYDLQVTNPVVASGGIDAQVDGLATALRGWLAGPDAAYGTADDRRAYFRPAWEMNGSWYRWSPCYFGGGTGTHDDFKAMWRRLHGRFAAAGLDRTRLAWIYSVNATDKVAACSAESLYPGDAHVDWTGIDGYTHTATASPTQVFAPMVARLRVLAPSKPVGVNEWGADSLTSIGKSAWIEAFFVMARQLDLRMALAFNVDKERDWAVLGGSGGDEAFAWAGAQLRGWSAYRRGVADARVAGPDAADPRRMGDARFLGLG